MKNGIKKWDIIKVLILILLTIFFTGGCRMSASSMELTKYIGDAVNVFERGTRTKLSEKDKGVYILENSIQLLAPGGKIASITLLEDSKEFTIHGLSVGWVRKRLMLYR